MPNPNFSNRTSPNGATAPNDSLNHSSKKYFQGYNKFNLTRQFYNTERYADINVIDVVEGVEGDKLTFANKHDIRTYTMKSPIMFDIYKKKSYFLVNNQAILPRNWKLIYKQPNKGDDVPDDANCTPNLLFGFVTRVSNSFRLNSLSELKIGNGDNAYNYMFRLCFLYESIFSNGSLLSSMNCHLSNSLSFTDGNGNVMFDSFDDWFEGVMYYFKDRLYVRFPQLNKTFTTDPYNEDTSKPIISLRNMLDLMRTFSDFYVENLKFEYLDFLYSHLRMVTVKYPNSTDPLETVTNISRLLAYQMVCSQFYTRDSVDSIYSSEMFLDNQESLLSKSQLDYFDISSFTYNGTRFRYDVHSACVIDNVLKFYTDDFYFNIVPDFQRDIVGIYSYLMNIFGFRKSLRYGDYFVGAKTLPFAPLGDATTADVVGNGVSALDMTRSIIAQRFANLVERTRNTWEDYLKGVTGGSPSPDPKLPRFLASTTSKVGGFEVENTTSENQGNIVTVLRSSNSNYIYEVDVNEPCIIIGVSTYEVPRVYSATIERFFTHTDRFNMFNKSFQNIGDQEITQNERNASFSPSQTFGYTPRHMEYKQRYPFASGGFVNDNILSSYAFITDNKSSGQTDTDLVAEIISPFYLRNRNSEFDRYYSSLTGLSLASYFHFIVKYDNIVKANRQMEYSPSIL